MEYSDTALDDFMSRFGDNDPNKEMVQKRKKVIPINSNQLGMASIKDDLDPLAAKAKGIDLPKGEGLLSGIGAEEIMDTASGVLQLGQMAKGDMYDTSANSGGIMNAQTAITSGAMTGANAGKILGPWGMVAGAAIGGAIGGISRGKAAKEYGDNLIKKNLNDNRISKAENAETYAMEQGQESLGLLKGLRQKQLGIINT